MKGETMKKYYDAPQSEVVMEVLESLVCTSGDGVLEPGQGEDWGNV